MEWGGFFPAINITDPCIESQALLVAVFIPTFFGTVFNR